MMLTTLFLVSGITLMGVDDIHARGGGGHGGGGFHGGGGSRGGGWSGSRSGGYGGGERFQGGGDRFQGGREFNRDRDWRPDDRPRPDPDHHPRPTPPAPPPPPTYNVNVNAPDGWWYGGADDALAGMAVGTMVGAAAANNNNSGSTTVVVENPPQTQYQQQVQVGNQSAMLPSGSQARSVNGAVYYQNGDTWYRPYFGTNGVYYEVVPAPGISGQ